MNNKKIFLFFHLNLITLCAFGMDKIVARMQYAHAAAHANASASASASAVAGALPTDLKAGAEVGRAALQPVSLTAGVAAADQKKVGERLLSPHQTRVVERLTAEFQAKFPTYGKNDAALSNIHRTIFPIKVSSIKSVSYWLEELLRMSHDSVIYDVSLDKNNTKAVTSSRNGVVKIWELKTESELSTRKFCDCADPQSILKHDGTGGFTLCMNSDCDKQLLGLGFLWTLEKNKQPFKILPSNSSSFFLKSAFNHDDTKLLLVEPYVLGVVDLKTNERYFHFDFANQINDAVFNHDSSKIFVAADKAIYIVDIQTRQCSDLLSELDPMDKVFYEMLFRIAFNHNYTQLVVTSGKYAIIVDTQTGKELSRFQHRSGVNAASFNHDGTQVVTATDQATYIWDINEKRSIVNFEFGSMKPTFSRDGTRIIFAVNDTAVLWDLTEINRYYNGDIPADQMMFLWQLNQKKASGEKTIELDEDSLTELRTFPRLIQRRIVEKFGISNPPKELGMADMKQAEKGAAK